MNEVLKQMVDALEYHTEQTRPISKTKEAIQAGKQAIAKLESQEPVALPCCGYTDASAVKWNPLNGVVQCHNCGQNYTTPPQRTEPVDYEKLAALGWQAIECGICGGGAMGYPQRTWVELTEVELRLAFGKLYPNDIGLLELAENNRDYAVEAIGARHHWTAFKAGARAGEAKLKEKNND